MKVKINKIKNNLNNFKYCKEELETKVNKIKENHDTKYTNSDKKSEIQLPLPPEPTMIKETFSQNKIINED